MINMIFTIGFIFWATASGYYSLAAFGALMALSLIIPRDERPISATVPARDLKWLSLINVKDEKK